MSDEIIPASEIIIITEFVISNLYSYPGDQAGSTESLASSDGDAFAKAQLEKPAPKGQYQPKNPRLRTR